MLETLEIFPDELNGATCAGIDALMIDDVDGSSVDMLRVGFVGWRGPSGESMAEINRYVRETT